MQATVTPISGAEPKPSAPDFSYQWLWDRMTDIADSTQHQFLDIWKHIGERELSLLKDLEKLFSDFQKWLESDPKDPRMIRIHIAEMREALQRLRDRYQADERGILVPPDGQQIDEATARHWADELGDGYTASYDAARGSWVVRMDLGALDQMIAKLPQPRSDGWAVLNLEEYAGWHESVNGLHDEMKKNAEIFSQKYANANSMSDFIQKMLNSLVESSGRTLRESIG